ncbi:MAG: DUF86 domain-containing protein [Dehalococcoidia bacterium]
MKRHRLLGHIQDISDACDRISRFAEGKDKNAYLSDILLQAGVERQFITIGEALNLLLKEEPTLVLRITDAVRIISFRNRLVHGYADISEETVWSIVEGYVPTLQREVELLLSEFQAPPENSA